MSEIVKGYYDDNAQGEWQRLENPYSKIEFLSTLYLIDKYFPKEGSVLDVGSGPGRYSIEMLKRGFDVSLWELSSKELEIAKEKIEGLGLRAQAYICQDALKLDLVEDEKYDIVLLMGPLYHIQDDEGRMRVLKNTRRILKSGGRAIIAYLNSWGILKAGVTEFFEAFSDIQNVYNYLDDQKFGADRSFTEVYFATPPRALEEVKNAGFEIVSYAGAEGFLGGIESGMKKLYAEHRDIYDNLVKVAAETCEYPQYRDATEHLHIVVQK